MRKWRGLSRGFSAQGRSSRGDLRWAWLLLVGLLGCGSVPPDGRPSSEVEGLVLRLTGGSYSDGSGRVGLALLATFRDVQGRGPTEPWSATLSDSHGALTSSFVYPAGTEPGSHVPWWWWNVGLAPGETYRLELSRADGVSISASFTAPDSQGPPVPSVTLSADGARLTWEPVPGAASYGCQVFKDGTLQLSWRGSAMECDLSALPTGTYTASVLAFSTSLEALAADVSQRPPLPMEFHVSEGRLAFSRGQEPGTTLRVGAAGGALHYGRTQPGLALWVGLIRADGTPLEEGGTVELIGPGLRSETPLRFSYPPRARQHLVWSYDTPPLLGRYTLTARVGAQVLSTSFSIGELGSLAAPLDVKAVSSASGGSRVSWQAVAGARTYYVSVWDNQGSLTAVQWASEASASFAAGTFEAGRVYDVYVAATDVDLASTTMPTRVTVSENTYLPANFIAQ